MMTLGHTPSHRRPRRRSLLAAAALALLAHPAAPTAQTRAARPDARAGARIYREGVLPSGESVRASMQGGLAVEGTRLNCAGCHRRSGFGSSEGAAYVPPVTGAALYREKGSNGVDLFRRLFQEVQPARLRARLRGPLPRPAYTDESLAAALREGRDPAGRELDPLMPRYRLSDEDAGHLAAYLKSLSAAPAPGVDASAVHFATVVAEGAAPEKRRALLDVMGAYFRWKNADTAGMRRRSGSTVWYEEELPATYREWVLHVWELKGAPATWPAQLDAYYGRRPVFALLGGVGEGSWRPVHDFCEREEVPCLFPDTELPADTGGYTLYLSGGLAAEAGALARRLRERAWPAGAKRVVQVYRDEGGGPVLGRALARELRGRGAPDLRERVIHGSQKLTPAFWRDVLEAERPSVLVLWLDETDLTTWDSARTPADAVAEIYLSYGLLQETPRRALKGFRDRVYLTYPYALPSPESPHVYRVRAWLRARGVARAPERLQLNAHFALSVADHSLMRLAGNFSRDYFVEAVEQETETALNPGVFPRLSLGPGQRFASKGSYLVKPSDGAPGGLAAASGWIIP
jgi:cytochrome c553